jgi:hypothetical protein
VDSIASALKTMFRIALGKEVDEARSAEPATIDDAFVRADNRRRQALAEFQRAAGSSAPLPNSRPTPDVRSGGVRLACRPRWIAH